MSTIVDIELLIREGDKTGTNLEKVIKSLEKIEKASNIAIKFNNKEVKDVKKTTEEITETLQKSNDKEKIALQLLDMKIKRVKLLKGGYTQSHQEVQKYIKQLENKIILSKEQLKNLQLTIETEKSQIATQKESIRETERKSKEIERQNKELEKQNAKQLGTLSVILNSEKLQTAEKEKQLRKQEQIEKAQERQRALQTKRDEETISTIETQQLKMQLKLQQAIRNEWVQSIPVIEQYIKHLNDGNILTSQQKAELNLIVDKDKEKNQALQTEVKARQGILKLVEAEKQAKMTHKDKVKAEQLKIKTQLLKSISEGWTLSTEKLKEYQGILSNNKLLTKEQMALLQNLNQQDKQRINDQKEAKDKEILIQKQLTDLTIKRANFEAEGNTKAVQLMDVYISKLHQKRVLSQQDLNNIRLKTNELKLQNKQMAQNLGTAEKLNSTFLLGLVSRRMDGVLKSQTSSLKQLDTQVYNLGVVADRTVGGIERLRGEMLDLATTFTQTASEMAKSIDTIMRTGMAFEDALQITQASARLATASGESLTETTQVLTKAIVAFGLSGEEAESVMNVFHSAVLNTPLNLKGLNDSLKNSASSFATLIEFTRKSGEELTEYKKELLEINVAMTGQLAQLGLNASQSGTIIRFFINRLLSAEQTAIRLFDNLNLQLDGTTLTFDRFSRIASQDLTEALDILSSNFDRLADNREVIARMFTSRHWAKIAPLIAEMSGNTREWMQRINEGRDVIEDFEKQMSSLENRLSLLSNALEKSKETLYSGLKDVQVTTAEILMTIVQGMGELDTAIGRTAATMSITTTKAMAFFTALRLVVNMAGVKGGLLAGLVTGKAGLVFAGLAATMGYIISKQSEQKRLVREIEEAELERLKTIQATSEEYARLNSSIERQRAVLQKMELKDLQRDWRITSDLTQDSLDKLREYTDSLRALDDISRGITGLLDIKIEVDLDKINEVSERRKQLEQEISNTLNDNISFIQRYKKEIQELTSLKNVGWNILKRPVIELRPYIIELQAQKKAIEHADEALSLDYRRLQIIKRHQDEIERLKKTKEELNKDSVEYLNIQQRIKKSEQDLDASKNIQTGIEYLNSQLNILKYQNGTQTTRELEAFKDIIDAYVSNDNKISQILELKSKHLKLQNESYEETYKYTTQIATAMESLTGNIQKGMMPVYQHIKDLSYDTLAAWKEMAKEVSPSSLKVLEEIRKNVENIGDESLLDIINTSMFKQQEGFLLQLIQLGEKIEDTNKTIEQQLRDRFDIQKENLNLQDIENELIADNAKLKKEMLDKEQEAKDALQLQIDNNEALIRIIKQYPEFLELGSGKLNQLIELIVRQISNQAKSNYQIVEFKSSLEDITKEYTHQFNLTNKQGKALLDYEKEHLNTKLQTLKTQKELLGDYDENIKKLEDMQKSGEGYITNVEENKKMQEDLIEKIKEQERLIEEIVITKSAIHDNDKKQLEYQEKLKQVQNEINLLGASRYEILNNELNILWEQLGTEEDELKIKELSLGIEKKIKEINDFKLTHNHEINKLLLEAKYLLDENLDIENLYLDILEKEYDLIKDKFDLQGSLSELTLDELLALRENEKYYENMNELIQLFLQYRREINKETKKQGVELNNQLNLIRKLTRESELNLNDRIGLMEIERDYIDSNIKSLEEKIKLFESEEATNENINELQQTKVDLLEEEARLRKLNADLLHEQLSGTYDLINAMTSGQMGFSVDTKAISNWISDAFNLSDLEGISNAVGFVVQNSFNILDRVVDSQVQAIDNEIKVLEMRSELIKNEDELNRHNERIQQLRRQATEVEIRNAAITNIAGGVMQGAMAGATYGLKGIAIGGVVGFLGGLFQTGQAKREIELQEKLVREQEHTNRLLEIQNNILNRSNDILQKMVNDFKNVGGKFAIGQQREMQQDLERYVQGQSLIPLGFEFQDFRKLDLLALERWKNRAVVGTSSDLINNPRELSLVEYAQRQLYDLAEHFGIITEDRSFVEWFLELENVITETRLETQEWIDSLNDLKLFDDKGKIIRFSLDMSKEDWEKGMLVLDGFANKYDNINKLIKRIEGEFQLTYFGYDIEQITDEDGKIDFVLSQWRGFSEGMSNIYNDILNNTDSFVQGMYGMVFEGFLARMVGESEAITNALTDIENAIKDMPDWQDGRTTRPNILSIDVLFLPKGTFKDRLMSTEEIENPLDRAVEGLKTIIEEGENIRKTFKGVVIGFVEGAELAEEMRERIASLPPEILRATYSSEEFLNLYEDGIVTLGQLRDIYPEILEYQDFINEKDKENWQIQGMKLERLRELVEEERDNYQLKLSLAKLEHEIMQQAETTLKTYEQMGMSRINILRDEISGQEEKLRLMEDEADILEDMKDMEYALFILRTSDNAEKLAWATEYLEITMNIKNNEEEILDIKKQINEQAEITLNRYKSIVNGVAEEVMLKEEVLSIDDNINDKTQEYEMSEKKALRILENRSEYTFDEIEKATEIVELGITRAEKEQRINGIYEERKNTAEDLQDSFDSQIKSLEDVKKQYDDLYKTENKLTINRLNSLTQANSELESYYEKLKKIQGIIINEDWDINELEQEQLKKLEEDYDITEDTVKKIIEYKENKIEIHNILKGIRETVQGTLNDYNSTGDELKDNLETLSDIKDKQEGHNKTLDEAVGILNDVADMSDGEVVKSAETILQAEEQVRLANEKEEVQKRINDIIDARIDLLQRAKQTLSDTLFQYDLMGKSEEEQLNMQIERDKEKQKILLNNLNLSKEEAVIRAREILDNEELNELLAERNALTEEKFVKKLKGLGYTVEQIDALVEILNLGISINNNQERLNKQLEETCNIYNALENAILNTNFYLASQEEIYDNLISSVATMIRNELKKTVVQTFMEERLAKIRGWVLELQGLSIKQRDIEIEKAQKLGQVEVLNAKQRNLQSEAYRMQEESYTDEQEDDFIKRVDAWKKQVELIGGTTTSNILEAPIDWTTTLQVNDFKEEMQKITDLIKGEMQDLASELANPDSIIGGLMKMIDELWGDHLFGNITNAIKELTSNFQRLPDTLRDIRRQIDDFGIAQEESIKKQKEYNQLKRQELESERNLFRYNESMLNFLKTQHNQFIEAMKSQEKINALGEIDFENSEELKKEYDNRLTLINNIERVLTEIESTTLTQLQLEEQLNELYKSRAESFDNMSKSLKSTIDSLDDAFFEFTMLGKEQEKIDELTLERDRGKLTILEQSLGLSGAQVQKTIQQLIANEDILKLFRNKNEISESEYENILKTYNLTKEQIEDYREWLRLSTNIHNAMDDVEDTSNKFTSNFQRLSTALRDVNRQIADFNLSQENAIKKQIEYNQLKKQELESEKNLFRYNEGILNLLKTKHNEFIETMKSQGKINALGEIDFDRNEDLKQTYDDRLALIGRIESLLAEIENTSLTQLQLERQLNEIYQSREDGFNNMNKSLNDNLRSLDDAYFSYLMLFESEEEATRLTLQRNKDKLALIEQSLNMSSEEVENKIKELSASEDILDVRSETSKISEEQYEILENTYNLTKEEIDELREWLRLSTEIHNATKEIEEELDKFTSNFQRLPQTLRDIKREINDFNKLELQRLEIQKQYIFTQATMLARELQMLGYSEEKLENLKNEHNQFIRNMRLQEKINELGEIQFGTDEALKEEYEERLALINKMESLLTEIYQVNLDQMSLEKQINDLYKSREETFDNMNRSVVDGMKSLADSYFDYTMITKTQLEIEELTLKRNKEKLRLLEQEIGLTGETLERTIQMLSLQADSMRRDELILKLFKDKSKLSDEEFKTLENTYNLTREQLENLEEWLSLSGEILKQETAIANNLREGLVGAFRESLKQDNYVDAVNTLGNFFTGNITESIIDGLISHKFQNQLENLYQQLFANMQSGFNVGMIQQSALAIQRIQLQAESERNRLQLFKDMITYNQDIDFSAEQRQIQYSTGTTSTNTYNYNYHTTISSLITTDNSSVQKFANTIADKLIVSFKDKGYNMDKLR